MAAMPRSNAAARSAVERAAVEVDPDRLRGRCEVLGDAPQQARLAVAPRSEQRRQPPGSDPPPQVGDQVVPARDGRRLEGSLVAEGALLSHPLKVSLSDTPEMSSSDTHPDDDLADVLAGEHGVEGLGAGLEAVEHVRAVRQAPVGDPRRRGCR